MQTDFAKIWTRFTDSIFRARNHDGIPYLLKVEVYKSRNVTKDLTVNYFIKRVLFHTFVESKNQIESI